MQKKVTLELSVDEEYASTAYKMVGELLEYLEDSSFGVEKVSVDDWPKLVMTSPRLGSLR